MPGCVNPISSSYTYTPQPISHEEEAELISIRTQREKIHAALPSIKPDTITSYDEDEDQRLKKNKPFDVYVHALPPVHVLPSTPQLASPQAIQTSLSDAQVRILGMAVQLAQAMKDVSQSKPLDETTQSPLKTVKAEDSDLNLDKEVFDRLNSLRLLKNEMMGLVYHLVNKKLQSNKALFEDQKAVEDLVQSKAKVSEVLEWVQTGSTVALVVLSVAAFATSIATAGLMAGVMASIATIPSVVNGVVGATNGMIQLQMQEKQGIALELKEIRTMEHQKVQTLLGDNQAILLKINDLMRLAAQLARHMSQVKFF